jgi:hypothetical protein
VFRIIYSWILIKIERIILINYRGRLTMNKYFNNKEKAYYAIIDILREYKGLTKNELFQILKDNDCRHLFFLLIKKYGCFDLELLKKDLPSISKNKLNNNIKRAEEKLLFNKKIRNMYFEAEELIDKIK